MAKKERIISPKLKHEIDSEEAREMESLKSNFTCAICLSITEEPCIIPCSHLFCYSCLMHWIKLNSEPSCPKCRTLFGVDSVVHINTGDSSSSKNALNYKKKFLNPGFSCQKMRFGNLIVSKADNKKPSLTSVAITTFLSLILMITAEFILIVFYGKR